MVKAFPDLSVVEIICGGYKTSAKVGDSGNRDMHSLSSTITTIKETATF